MLKVLNGHLVVSYRNDQLPTEHTLEQRPSPHPPTHRSGQLTTLPVAYQADSHAAQCTQPAASYTALLALLRSCCTAQPQYAVHCAAGVGRTTVVLRNCTAMHLTDLKLT